MKKIIGILVLLYEITILILFVSIGFFTIRFTNMFELGLSGVSSKEFESYYFKSIVEFGGILIFLNVFFIIIGLFTRLLLENLVFKNFKTIIWDDNVKQNMWEKLFSSNGFFINTLGITKIIYYWIIIRDNIPNHWWDIKMKESFWAKVFYKKTLLNLLSYINTINAPLFLTFFSLGPVFMLLLALEIPIIPFLLLKLNGLYFIIILPLAGFYQHLIIIHMVSKKWTTNDYNVFLRSNMFKIISFRSYYQEILKKELDK